MSICKKRVPIDFNRKDFFKDTACNTFKIVSHLKANIYIYQLLTLWIVIFLNTHFNIQ